MKIVYLDQNKWIEIARIYHGKNPNPDSQRVLSVIRDKIEQGVAVFPLSWVHYIETAKNSNHERRRRLGTVMWELSRGYTMASSYHLICYELETALAQRFQNVSPRPLNLLSTGYAHTFGKGYSYRLPEELRSSIPVEVLKALETQGQEILEKAVITGEGPGGIRLPSPRNTQYNEQFKQHLETLPARASHLLPEQWDDELYVMALLDVKDPLVDVLHLHGLSFQGDLLPLGKEGLIAISKDLPSRKVEVHMHRQILKNPQLKPRITDLEDWSGLGPASAHCDVVVCEKHFANLVRRDGFRPKAQVLTDLRKLPEII